jgi:hypothetical protein
MRKSKNVCILRFNEPDLNGNIVKYVDVKKKTLVINEGFDNTRIIGNATNIVAKEDGLYADLEFLDEEKLLSDAYPAIKFDKEYEKVIINSQLMGISVGDVPHAQEELRGNIKNG